MIRGRTRILRGDEDTPSGGIGIETSIHNKFEIEVKDITTGEIRQIGKAENIILDQYWTHPEHGVSSHRFSPGYFIAFGTGTGSISPDRTEMFNLLGWKAIINNTKTVVNNREEKYFVFSGEIELLPSEYVGSELTEVGLFSAIYNSLSYVYSASSLMTHALFKDANNNPISIVKTSTDLITIKASVYLHYPHIDLKTTAISYLVPTNAGAGTAASRIRGWLGGILPALRYPLDTQGVQPVSLGPGMSNIEVPSSNITVDGVNKKSTMVVPRAETTSYNARPIMGFSIAGRFYQRIPQELYSDITNEVVGVGDGIKTDFSTYFPFPMNAVVKIDGVESTDVTVHQTYGTSFPTLAIGSFINRIYSNGDLHHHSGTINENSFSTGSIAWSAGGAIYYENVFPDQGIYRIRGVGTNYEKFISYDLEDWISMGTASTVNIPEEHQNFRFVKFVAKNAVTESNLIYFDTNPTDNIIFNTPPPEGTVIEVDYTFPGIAKDANHVLDMEIELSFGNHEE